MSKVSILLSACALTTFCVAASAQPDSGLQNLKAMTFFKGDCKMQIVEGYSPCRADVMWGEFTTGRAALMFFKDNLAFSISGSGDRQPNLENYFQSVDRIRIMEGPKLKTEIPMEGECHFSMNEQATAFYYIHCDVYNRRQSIAFNFHLDNIVNFERKIFDP